jgi:hypothetical protein
VQVGVGRQSEPRGKREHRRGDVDRVDALEALRQRSCEPPDPAADLEGPPAAGQRRRPIERRRDQRLAGCDELLDRHAAADRRVDVVQRVLPREALPAGVRRHPCQAIVARMSSVTTNVTELPESRVRVAAEVSADEVERRLQQAAKRLGSTMRIPGFRKGKVPPAVVIRRLGREAVLDEAVRSSLGSWYVDAIDEAGISPIGEPDLDMSDLPDQGKPLEFSIEIGVRPKAQLGEYKGVEVGRREPKVEESAIDEQVEELRNRVATLETVERAAAAGDQVVVD